jgi:hypothetical protein
MHHSTHSKFDDPHYWEFSRKSGLPWGYFDRRPIITTDALAVVVCVVGLIIGLWVTQ